MDLVTAIRSRRSVRSFTGEAVSDEQIEELLDLARWAPTGGNMQPWEFIVIRDRELIERLVAATYVGYDSKTGTPQKWILGADVVIFVGINVKRSGSRYGELGVALAARLDCAAAVQNMLLGATGLGLGATWVAGYDEDKVCKCLDLPEDVIPFSLIAIGHPARVPDPPYRLPVDDIVDYR